MKNTTDQNKYFEALNVITITGQTNNNLDSLLDNMFTEFDHNIIGLSFEMSQELLTIIGKRFSKVNLNQWNFRNYTQKFYDAINLRDKEVRQKLVQGFDNYEKEKLPSGLMILKNKLSETGIGNKTTGSSSINLKWKGSKTQMYYVIRQLKSNKVLVSSYEDIGLFLIQNIDKFAGSQLSTVINELQKTKYDKIPTGKRIDLKGLNELNEDQI